MAIPWLRIIDTVLGLTDFARGKSARALDAESGQIATGGRTLGHLETRLTGVVLAALKEAFDRDAQRLDVEREHLEAERQRAERALELELLRQAADREIGRLRLLGGVAVATWLGTLFFSARLIGAGVGARVTLGAGWALLLAALALSFVGQAHVTDMLARTNETSLRAEDLKPGSAGAVPWLIVLGLAAIGAAVLLA